MSKYTTVTLVKLESIEILPENSLETPIEDSRKQHQSDMKCTICPLAFLTKEELREHIRGHFKSIKCDKCNKILVGDKQYEYHTTHVHCSKEKRSGENSRKALSLSDDSIDVTKNDNCDLNEISFDEMNGKQLSNHAACGICGRLFENEEAVERHKKTHSIEGKRFICGFCGNGFNKKTNLEFHIRIHTNERPFACDKCPKRFSHISGLNCHSRVHSGERPYKCPYCVKHYAHSSDLRRHRRTHGMEEKRFQCNLCSKAFYERKFLKTHMKSHCRDAKRNILHADRNDSTNDTHIDKLEDSTNDEYIDYEYIYSD